MCLLREKYNYIWEKIKISAISAISAGDYKKKILTLASPKLLTLGNTNKNKLLFGISLA